MEDLTGKIFGKWTVLQRVENNNRGASMWKCKCQCGNISIIPGSNLRTGRTTGYCNCHGDALGMSTTSIYKVWRNMKARCYYSKDREYKDYGERGIIVYDKWKNNFKLFYKYVSKLENYGKEGYTLDRINVNGNYEPGNLRWATRYEQTHNRRNSKKILTHNAECSMEVSKQ